MRCIFGIPTKVLASLVLPSQQSAQHMSQVTRWCFTLNNYQPHEEETLQILGNGPHTRYLVYGREVGQEGTPHLQGFVIFARSQRLQAAKALLGARVHLEVARGRNDQAANYCKKDDDFEEFGSLPNERGRRNDFHELKEWVVQQPNKPSQQLIANEFPDLYIKYGRLMEWVNLIYPSPELVTGTPRPWQSQLATELAQPADDRRILFYVDPIGGSGKSWFIKYWYTSHSDSTQRLSIGKRDDLAYAIDESKQYFFFDIPRSQSEFLQYSILESLKDRMVFSPKYTSYTKILGVNPHVVVFMNEEPDRNKLSADRYKVTHIRQI